MIQLYRVTKNYEGVPALREVSFTIDKGEFVFVTGPSGAGKTTLFNAITGDFSRGAAGFWIENGELAYPVSEVTIAANFDQILKRIDLVANDLVLRSSTAAPTFRVSHMMLAGTSR